MRTLAKILLPVDFSERSLGAARYAETLACHFRAELVLLHVLTPPHYEFGALEIGGSMLSELYVNRAAQVRGELENFPGEAEPVLRLTRLVLEGDPARTIVEYAHSEHVDLIVMPTHGYGPFRRFILGSITAKVLHDADCPVWTGVHLQDAPRPDTIGFENIVCAVDLGPQSARALEWAAGLQQEFHSRLTVVHVNTCTQDPRGQQNDTDWRMELQRAARDEAHRLMQRVGSKGELLIETGDPASEVCAAAERLRTDLLVIGRGSAGGVFGRLRTNAYAIIRQSPCPVVSV